MSLAGIDPAGEAEQIEELALLDGLHNLAPREHVAVYEAIHDGLVERLGRVED